MLYALDPQREPDFSNPAGTRLEPINFAAQWPAGTDIAAEQEIESVVEDVINGRLNPDEDGRAQWYAQFGNSNQKNKPTEPPPKFRGNLFT